MPVVLFKGRVLPESTDLSVTDISSIDIKKTAAGSPDLSARIHVAINHSVIDVICNVEQYDSSLLSPLMTRALHIVEAVVDLYVFATARSVSVIIDRVVDERGIEFPIFIEAPHLKGICTVGNLSGEPGKLLLGRALPFVSQEPNLFLALHDLVSALAHPNRVSVDSARAVEGLRVAINPTVADEDKKKGWELLQANLNLTKDYISLITKASEPLRHGNRNIDPPPSEEVVRRSWTIMNRFLEFRLRGNQPLLLSEFPLL